MPTLTRIVFWPLAACNVTEKPQIVGAFLCLEKLDEYSLGIIVCIRRGGCVRDTWPRCVYVIQLEVEVADYQPEYLFAYFKVSHFGAC